MYVLPGEVLTEEFLIHHYVMLKKSVAVIAREANVRSQNSVCQKLKKYGIYRDSVRKLPDYVNEEYMYEQYIINKKAQKTIAQELGITKSRVKTLLKKYNIELRKGYVISDKVLKGIEKRKVGYKDIPGRWWNEVIRGAKERFLEFAIDIVYAWELFEKQNGKCALTGTKIYFKDELGYKTASLDRIDSSKGYTKDNVQWVHVFVNKLKMNYDEKILYFWCKAISNHLKSKYES